MPNARAPERFNNATAPAELANYRAALKSSPSETVARWISETEDRRKAAEIRLRRATENEGMTADEIRDIVDRMNGIVAILQSANAEDRRKVYEAANLTITYDHGRKTTKLHASPNPGPWSSVRVGGGTRTTTAPPAHNGIERQTQETSGNQTHEPDSVPLFAAPCRNSR